jgi:replicative DNA helicase
VPVIALSQLSRQPEMRESKEPRLSDLRESGAIEQDADLVVFLWRDKERAGEEERDAEGEIINLKLAKHRNGPTGEVQLWFKKRQTRFVSYAGERFAEVN